MWLLWPCPSILQPPAPRVMNYGECHFWYSTCTHSGKISGYIHMKIFRWFSKECQVKCCFLLELNDLSIHLSNYAANMPFSYVGLFIIHMFQFILGYFCLFYWCRFAIFTIGMSLRDIHYTMSLPDNYYPLLLRDTKYFVSLGDTHIVFLWWNIKLSLYAY